MGQKLLLLALAGACGTLARYGVANMVQRWTGPAFPWGTFAVNAIGCFLFGLLWALFEHRHATLGALRVAALAGFLGSFTTFSSFAHDTGALLRGSEWGLALLNVTGQNLVGLCALFGGVAVARLLA